MRGLAVSVDAPRSVAEHAPALLGQAVLFFGVGVVQHAYVGRRGVAEHRLRRL
jgi:hypothetical protein